MKIEEKGSGKIVVISKCFDSENVFDIEISLSARILPNLGDIIQDKTPSNRFWENFNLALSKDPNWKDFYGRYLLVNGFFY